MAGMEPPVPSVVRYESAPPELERSIALTTHIPGVPVSTLPPARWLGDVAVGRVLARINAIEVAGFGWAYSSTRNGTPVGGYTSRAAWIREYLKARRTLQASDALPVPVTGS